MSQNLEALRNDLTFTWVQANSGVAALTGLLSGGDLNPLFSPKVFCGAVAALQKISQCAASHQTGSRPVPGWNRAALGEVGGSSICHAVCLNSASIATGIIASTGTRWLENTVDLVNYHHYIQCAECSLIFAVLDCETSSRCVTFNTVQLDSEIIKQISLYTKLQHFFLSHCLKTLLLCEDTKPHAHAQQTVLGNKLKGMELISWGGCLYIQILIYLSIKLF